MLEETWDPRAEAFADPKFNVYDHGPAKGLGPATKFDDGIAERDLYIGGIPRTLEPEGLKNIFSRCGKVVKAEIKQPREKDARTTFGFVRYKNHADSVQAIAKLNKFEIENGKYRLQVKVAMTEEESRQRFLDRQERARLEALEYGDDSSDSDPGAPFVRLEKRAEGDKKNVELMDLDLSKPIGRGRPQSSPPKPVGGERSQQYTQQTSARKPETQSSENKPTTSRKPAMSGYASDTSIASMKPAAIGTCIRCHKPAKHRCRRCQSFYCTADCQKLDWKEGHKIRCKQIMAQTDGAKPKTNNHVPQINPDDFEVMVESGAVDKVLKMSGVSKESVEEVIKNQQNFEVAEEQRPPYQQPVKPQGHKRRKITDLKFEKLDKGVKVEINIQDITSPQDICITPASSATNLQMLSVQMKQEYINTTNIGADSYTPEKDEVVAVQYTDGDWYRAHVKSINLNGTVTMHFVDYGNTDDLPVAQIRKLQDYLCDLPTQVMHCELDVLPVLGSTWTTDSLACLAHLGCGDPTQKFICSALAKKDGVYRVNLVKAGDMIDLSEALVTEGLALRRPTSGTASPALAKSPPARQTPPIRSPPSRVPPTQAPPTKALPTQAPPTNASCSPARPKQAPPTKVSPSPAYPKQAPPTVASPKPAPPKQAPPTQPPPSQTTPPHDAGDPSFPPLFEPSIPTAQKFLQPASVIQFKVLEQITPSQFYVHIQGTAQLGQLPRLQVEMNEHYSKLPPKKGFRPNKSMLYACKFTHDGNWYRAYVYHYDASCARVVYLDYGNHEAVPFHHLHSLESLFCMLPFQAVCCRLAGVKGTEEGGKWTREAKHMFGTLVQDKVLRAQVAEVEPQQVALKVKLPDKRTLVAALIQAGLGIKTDSKPPTPHVSPPQPAALPPAPPAAKSPTKPVVQAAPVIPAVSKVHMMSDLPKMKLPDQLLHKAMVVDATTPSVLTVQLWEDKDIIEMNALTQLLQSTYAANAGGYRPSVLHSLVAAKFTQDDQWCRAEVVSIGEKFRVRFVEYGNEEELGAERLAELAPQFLEYPVFGLRCTLAGTGALVEGQRWVPDAILNKHYAMRVNAEKNGVLDVVLMEDNETVLNELLIKNNILLSKEAAKAKSTDTQAAKKVFEENTLPDLNLTQAIHDAMVVHFELPGEFYVQLETYRNELIEVMTEVKNQLENTSGEYTPSQFEIVGAFYEPDQHWYRCKVLSVSGRRAKVHFIDFGNADAVDVRNIRPLNPKFAQIPAYAVKSSLGGLTDDDCRWTAQAISKAETLLKDKHCKIAYDLTKRTSENAYVVLQVTLAVDDAIIELSNYLVQNRWVQRESLGRLGEEVASMTPEHPVQHLPPAAIDVSIQHINSPNDFYINILEDWSYTSLQNMLITLNQRVAAAAHYKPTDVGEMVAAKFENAWYRAQVKGLVKDKFKVFFCDFGNTELVEIADIRELPDEFKKLPSQAIHCELANLQPHPNATWSKEACRFMSSLLMKTMSLCPLGGGGDSKLHAIDLRLKIEDASGQSKPGETLSELLIQQGMARRETQAPEVKSTVTEPVVNGISAVESGLPGTPPKPTAASTPVAKTPVLPTFLSSHLKVATITDTEQCMVVDAEHVSTFYVQSGSDDYRRMLSLDDAFNEYCENTAVCESFKPCPGEMCMAKYSSDGRWYRAAVTEVVVPGHKWKVVMVDWGSVDTVDSSNIRPIPQDFMTLPRQAIKCALHGVNGENPEAIAVFKELTENKLLQCCVVKTVDDTAYVNMTNIEAGADINAAVKAKLPQPPVEQPPMSLEEENRMLKEKLERMEAMMAQVMRSQSK